MGSRQVTCALILAVALTGGGEALGARTVSATMPPPTLEGSPYKGSTLRCTPAQAGDVATWAWLRDGVAVTGATADTYVVAGSDLGHLLACVETVSAAGVSETATSAELQIVLVATAIANGSARVQRGPKLKVRGQVTTPTDGPPAVGQVVLIAVGRQHDFVVARTSADPSGRFALTRTIRGLVPGRFSFRVDFIPADPELHARAEQDVTVKALSPLTYPFARVTADRHVTLSDGLVAFWSDGSACAVGCRPPGVINGWPLKPFHEQHALRAGLNERRLSGFHVGIDIMTTFGQEIYAIQSGYAHILHYGDSAARVQVGNYIYWHVNLRVREGQYVRAYHTVLGYTLKWTRHLHLSEVDGAGSYLNPLRPGGRALTPWSDTEPPVIGRTIVSADGSAVVDVFDPQSFVPKIYYETPVLAPAAVAYRLFDAAGASIGGLEWALRGSRWLPNYLAGTVFAPDAHSPGFLCFARQVVCKPLWRYRLAGGLAPRLPLYGLRGRVRLTVYAWDWAGNLTARDTWLSG
jgi:murein DD-endopeptidase MepM/ murein hydrolase activator NlpD